MEELFISRKRTLEILETSNDINQASEIIKTIPVIVKRKAKWTQYKFYYEGVWVYKAKCSNCNGLGDVYYRYCPYCGSHMKGE